jgi:two-component sensor histidine kinase
MKELVTNAIQHSRTVESGGRVHIELKNTTTNFSIRVSDSGNGPATDAQSPGLGNKIVEALAHQMDATVTNGRLSAGYADNITIPHSVKTGCQMKTR